MIADRNRAVQMQSTAEGEKIAMSVDANSMEHIMGLLTDLYSDPELAVIREYATNANDAHVEAGQSRPIEVTLPSQLSPFMRVKDFGIGLDADGITRIYSQYGASTKRGTNEQNGMLGLGCKSALTYTDQFSLVGRKDGISTTVSITRDAQGRGQMQITNTMDTDEPNGVEVLIPVKRNNDIQAKAEEFFSFWPEGKVLVNGKEPKKIEGLRVSDNMIVTEQEGHPTDYIVMGNVAYPTNERLDTGLHRPFGLVAFVKIGEVNFTPSREALMDEPITKATLERVTGEFKANARAAIQRAMDNAATPDEAIETMVNYHSMLGVLRHGQPMPVYTYKGQQVPLSYKDSRVYACAIEEKQSHYYYRGRTKAYQEGQMVPASRWKETFFIGRFTPEKLSIDQRRKVRKYLEDKGITAYTRMAFCASTPTLPFLKPDQVVDYESIIKPIKLNPVARDGTTAKRIKGSYHVVDHRVSRHVTEVAGDDIDQTRAIFFSEGGKNAARAFSDFLNVHYPDCIVVGMGANRIEKFKRDFPKAKTARVGIQGAYDKWVKRLSADVKLGLVMHDAGGLNLLKKLDESRVDDPEVCKYIRAAKVRIKDALRARQTFMRYRAYINWSDGTDLPAFDNPLDKYPLAVYALGSGGYDIPEDHGYIYMNAVYAAATTKEVK